jgi:predicted nucleotidyltransferase
MLAYFTSFRQSRQPTFSKKEEDFSFWRPLSMQIIGIVAEYNPFHTGHAHQILESRAVCGGETAVVAVMSGNWTQQADCALADKWTRTRLALMGGVDLVLELPTLWAVSSAESFARGAVTLLDACGVVDVLSFGSEHGAAEPLGQIAACLDSEEYRTALLPLLETGTPFAACRQNAVETLLGAELSALLADPNNNLGIEYLRALNASHSHIRPITIPRRGSGHNAILDPEQSAPFVSATQLRLWLRAGNWDKALPYLVPGGQEVLEQSGRGFPSFDHVERVILAKLRTMEPEDWAKLPDSGAAEGLPQRLAQAGRTCTCLAHFFDLTKTKRYTHARLRRLVLWTFLGLTAADIPARPPYLRVLGFNLRGQELLKQMKHRAKLPILTKSAHVHNLDAISRKVLQLESRCTDLYDLCFAQPPAPGREWTTGPVILKEKDGR